MLRYWCSSLNAVEVGCFSSVLVTDINGVRVHTFGYFVAVWCLWHETTLQSLLTSSHSLWYSLGSWQNLLLLRGRLDRLLWRRVDLWLACRTCQRLLFLGVLCRVELGLTVPCLLSWRISTIESLHLRGCPIVITRMRGWLLVLFFLPLGSWVGGIESVALLQLVSKDFDALLCERLGHSRIVLGSCYRFSCVRSCAVRQRSTQVLLICHDWMFI